MDFSKPEHVCPNLAAEGNLAFLKRAHMFGFPLQGVAYSAARHGHFHILEWILEDWPSLMNSDAYAGAIKSNNWHVLKWLRLHKCPMSADILQLLINSKNFDMVKWALENEFPMKYEALELAARHGDLEMFEHLERNCPKDWIRSPSICANAAAGGQLHMLQWLQRNGYPINSDACKHAALNGHWEVLNWLRENNCPWSRNLCQILVKRGELAKLKHVRAMGCPWNKITFENLDVDNDLMKWAIANGCPIPNDFMNIALSLGDLDMIQLAIQYGKKFDHIHIYKAESWGRVNVLKWAYENEYIYASSTAIYEIFKCSISQSDYNMIRWAYESGLECPRIIENEMRETTYYKNHQYMSLFWLHTTKGLFSHTNVKNWLFFIMYYLELTIHVADLETLIKSYI